MADAPSLRWRFRSAIPAGIGPEVIAKCWDNRADVRPSAVRRDRRSALARGGVGRADRGHRRSAPGRCRLRLCLAADPGLGGRGADVPGHPSVAGAHCSLDSLELAVGLARSGSAAAVVTGPGLQGAALRDRLPASRPDRVRRRALRRFARQCRDDARRPDACGRSRSPPICRWRDVAGALTSALIESRGRAALARAAAQFRDRRAAARRVAASTRMPAKAASSAARRSRSSSRRSPRLPPKAGG